MKFINITCPPLPHFIAAGRAHYGNQNKHPTRANVGIFDIILVKSGILYICEEDTKYELKKNQYVILSPDTKHIGYKNSIDNTNFYWLHFFTHGTYNVCDHEMNLQEVNPIIHVDSFPKDCPFMISIPNYGTLDSITAKELESNMKRLTTVIVDLAKEKITLEDCPLHPLSQHEVFLSILDILNITKREPDNLDDIPTMVTNFIKTNFQKNFLLKDMAKQLNFHPNYITRVMKEKMSVTPMEYLMNYRINYSKYLLSHSKFSVKKIASESGFASPTYFTKIFKLRTGILPTQYREKMSSQYIY